MADQDPPRAQIGDTTPTLAERLLAPFAKVKPGEPAVVGLMTLTVFLVLCAYYVLKPAREALILPSSLFGIPGDELKSYAGAAMAIVLMAIIPAYSSLANRVHRLRLINISYAIVLGCLIVFFLLANVGFAQVGILFFVWIGLVNMFLVSQFWSYANDIYNEEQGKRLFAIIAVGGSLGAIVGPQLSKLFSVNSGMLVAAAILLVCIVLFNVIDKLQSQAKTEEKKEPLSGGSGFSLVISDKYLLLIGLMLLVANIVNSTGEFILSNAAKEHAAAMIAAGSQLESKKIIGNFYADLFFWVNLIGFIVQAFIVSRVFKYAGVRAALFVLPIVALGGYAAIGLVGGLVVIRAAKIGENSMDYSIQNTVRQALFLKTSRDAKYKAKLAIDTFFLRSGDLLSGLLVFLTIRLAGMTPRQLGFVNVGFVAIWLMISVGIARKHKALEAKDGGDHSEGDAKAKA